jgi:hypothetical protein
LIARGLEERQQMFEEYEAIYLKHAHLSRALTVRKETTIGFLAIPEHGTNVFSDHDLPDRRLETALRRKQVFRAYIEGGANVQIIFSVNPSGAVARGYAQQTVVARLHALKEFVVDTLDRENFHVARRPAGLELSRVEIYNMDVLISSQPLYMPRVKGGSERGERATATLAKRDIHRAVLLFDERFDFYFRLSVSEAKRRRLGKRSDSDCKKVKLYILAEIDAEIRSLEAVG